MNVMFRKSMDRLRLQVLGLGDRVRDQVDLAAEAIAERRGGVVGPLATGEAEIDVLEQEIEEECLHLMALHQPVAMDLRLLVTTLKTNCQLARVSRLAFNLGEQAELLAARPGATAVPFDLPTMSVTTREMLRLALEAMPSLDVEVATRVRAMDDVVDEIHRGMYAAVTRSIRQQPEEGPTFITLINVSRQFERIADYARGIAKDVIYLAEGAIVRHDKPAAMAGPPPGRPVVLAKRPAPPTRRTISPQPPSA